MLEYAACQTSGGIRRLLHGLRPGMTEREAVRLLDWNGDPLSCHLMLTAGPRATPRPAQPRRPADRARRPVHGRVRDLGRAQLPGRVRRRRTPTSCPPPSPTTSTASWRRTSRRSPSGTRRLRVGQTGGHAVRDHRPAPRRPVLRHLPQPGPPDPPRRVGQLTVLRRDSPIELRSGMAFQVDIIPATGTRLLHDQHRGRRRARRRGPARRRSRPPTRTRGRASRRGARSWRRARDRAPPRRPAVLEPARRTCRRSCSGRTTP